MKVLHLASELSGGAGLASLRLHRALRQDGVDSELLYGFGATGVEGTRRFEPTGSALAGYADRFLDQKVWKGRRPGAGLFSRTRRFVRSGLREALAGADIVQLHWIAKWLDWPSLFATTPFTRPIVLTMHDASFFAGGCHQTNDCTRFHTLCGSCPMLRRSGPRDLSHKGFKIRQRCFAGRKIIAVPNSGWMKAHASKAALLADIEIAEPIYPGIDTQAFSPLDQEACRKTLNIPADKFVVCAGSADLSDTNKGMGLLLEALKSLPADLLGRIALLTYGAGVLPGALSGVPVYQLGSLNSERLLAAAYSAADIYVTPSQMETFGMTAAEAAACGRPVIAFATGGLPEIVEDGVNGWLLPRSSGVGGLARAIEDAAADAAKRQRMGEKGREVAVSRLDIGISAKGYARIYERVAEASLGKQRKEIATD